MRDKAHFATIEEALEEIKAGRMVVVVDDEDRENEGDLTMAAQFVSPEAINFMAVHGRGLICLSMTEERAQTPASASDGTRQPVPLRHRLHRVHRGQARRDHRHLRGRPGAHHPGGYRPRQRRRGPGPAGARLSAGRARRAASWRGRVRPRRPSTWPAWRGSSRPGSSARS